MNGPMRSHRDYTGVAVKRCSLRDSLAAQTGKAYSDDEYGTYRKKLIEVGSSLGFPFSGVAAGHERDEFRLCQLVNAWTNTSGPGAIEDLWDELQATGRVTGVLVRKDFKLYQGQHGRTNMASRIIEAMATSISNNPGYLLEHYPGYVEVVNDPNNPKDLMPGDTPPDRGPLTKNVMYTNADGSQEVREVTYKYVFKPPPKGTPGIPCAIKSDNHADLDWQPAPGHEKAGAGSSTHLPMVTILLLDREDAEPIEAPLAVMGYDMQQQGIKESGTGHWNPYSKKALDKAKRTEWKKDQESGVPSDIPKVTIPSGFVDPLGKKSGEPANEDAPTLADSIYPTFKDGAELSDVDKTLYDALPEESRSLLLEKLGLEIEEPEVVEEPEVETDVLTPEQREAWDSDVIQGNPELQDSLLTSWGLSEEDKAKLLGTEESEDVDSMEDSVPEEDTSLEPEVPETSIIEEDIPAIPQSLDDLEEPSDEELREIEKEVPPLEGEFVDDKDEEEDEEEDEDDPTDLQLGASLVTQAAEKMKEIPFETEEFEEDGNNFYFPGNNIIYDDNGVSAVALVLEGPYIASDDSIRVYVLDSESGRKGEMELPDEHASVWRDRLESGVMSKTKKDKKKDKKKDTKKDEESLSQAAGIRKKADLPKYEFDVKTHARWKVAEDDTGMFLEPLDEELAD